MPWDGQLRVTELLMLTVQSVKLLSSTGGSKIVTATSVSRCVSCLEMRWWAEHLYTPASLAVRLLRNRTRELEKSPDESG